ncbi:MAG: hypothetical protein COU69_03960 [Candidatus Pacebacteria bacterium CG10_big_fil_rev_8_21_14_0_10_56_10]|nr:MAG: hypothetical protein COU69_03960 [Candidatus Pacebacteria bacterium CG10_big_fil_rev_8_21_14_0_10_56_10]
MKHGLQAVLFVAVFALFSWLYWLSKGALDETVLFAIGVGLGYGLMWLDRAWLYRYYHQPLPGAPGQPSPPPSWSKFPGRPNPPEQPYLVTRSFLFVLAYAPLAIFVVSTSGSSIGVGLILAIGFILLSELLMCRQSPQEFVSRFLHDQAEFSTREFNGLLVGYLVLFGLLSFWALG